MTLSPIPIRVMIVDDSAVARWMIQSVLDSEDDIAIAGTASNGAQAIERLDALHPDLVILDVEMPVMDGIETLKAVRRAHLDLPVVMFSSLTVKSAATTLEALALGASDYVTKPGAGAGRDAAIETVRSQLLPRIRALVPRDGVPPPPRPHSTVAAHPVRTGDVTRNEPVLRRSAMPGRFDAVVVGASTGGPNALTTVIPGLAESFPVPVFVVQHMPAIFTQMLADRLDGQSLLRVVESSPGMRARAGSVYLAQGGIHMVVRREGSDVFVSADDGPPEHSVKPSVDVLMRSAVKIWGGNVLGVMLTGMGEDGLGGSNDIVDAGGTVIVQDANTSLVWGMPGAVARAGLASDIVPLDKMAAAISGMVVGRARQVTS